VAVASHHHIVLTPEPDEMATQTSEMPEALRPLSATVPEVRSMRRVEPVALE
jgi:hypothetical protein